MSAFYKCLQHIYEKNSIVYFQNTDTFWQNPPTKCNLWFGLIKLEIFNIFVLVLFLLQKDNNAFAAHIYENLWMTELTGRKVQMLEPMEDCCMGFSQKEVFLMLLWPTFLKRLIFISFDYFKKIFFTDVKNLTELLNWKRPSINNLSESIFSLLV